MHSTYSYDGKLSLIELKNFLVRQGISFCCMTEHTDEMTFDAAHAFVTECKKLSDGSFVFIPGFEVPYKDAHILHIGAEEFVCQFADAEQLSAWRKVAPLVVLAHPVRNKFTLDSAMESTIDGVEVWNQQYEGKFAPRVRSLKLLKKLRRKTGCLFATGGLDLHREEHFGAPLTTIEIDSLSQQNILRALTDGAYTFGNDSYSLSSEGSLQKGGVFSVHYKSAFSILIITLGKFVNKTLANLGLSLPPGVRQTIRTRF